MAVVATELVNPAVDPVVDPVVDHVIDPAVDPVVDLARIPRGPRELLSWRDDIWRIELAPDRSPLIARSRRSAPCPTAAVSSPP